LCEAVGAKELKSFRNVEDLQAVGSDYTIKLKIINDSAPTKENHVQINVATRMRKVDESAKIVANVTSIIRSENFISKSLAAD